MMYKAIFNFLILYEIFANAHGADFPKRLDENVQFPPALERREGVPLGHLRPLGWQNRAEGIVKEESITLRPETFWDLYVSRRKPMMIRYLVSASDSTDKWTDEYLSRYYGHLDAQYTHLKEHMWESKSRMRMGEYLQRYRHDDIYLRVIMPEEMQHEAPMPGLVNCGPFVKQKEPLNELKLAQLVEPYLWISAGETASLLHSHPDHNLHCMLDGRMDFIFIPSDQFKAVANWRKKLGLKETYPNSNEWFSSVDVDMVNPFKFDLLKKNIWYWSTVKAGDCIYIPAGYLHQIRSHGRSISTSVYFSTLKQTINRVDLYEFKVAIYKQCPQNAPSFQPMSLVKENFMWTHTHGERHLKPKPIEERDLKDYLLNLVRESDSLNFERFENFFDEITKELEIEEKAKNVWTEFFLPEEAKKELTLEQIKGLDAEKNLVKFKSIIIQVLSFHKYKDKRRDDL